MNKNKYLPIIVSSFGAAVLNTVPGLKNFGCCLIVPAASMFALFLDVKINNTQLPLKPKTALLFGLLTGVLTAFFASFFDTLITFITHSNDFIENLPQTEVAITNFNLGPIVQDSMKILKEMAQQIRLYGFSPLYTIIVFTGNLFIFSIFGTLGGLLGMVFINRRTQPYK